MNTGQKVNPATLALLRRLPQLAGRSDGELAEVAPLVDDTEVPAGTVLTPEGTTAARQDFVIVEGWAAVMVDGEPVAALGPGQFAGEMALLDGQAPTATVVAKTDMRLLIVNSGTPFESSSCPPPVVGHNQGDTP